MRDKATVLRCWLTSRFARLPTATGCIALLVSAEALAAASGTPTQSPAGGGFLLAWLVAYLTRRHAIGGWLLYFYIQLYLSLLISLFFIPKIISNLNPTEWDTAMHYVLFVLSVVPALLAEVLEAFAATKLLLARNERNLRFLRKVLVLLAAASLVSVALDVAYFSNEVAGTLDTISLVFAVIWNLYFAQAKRVQLVFVDKTWHYVEDAAPRPRAPEEKRYLWRRAALIGAITFIAALLLMGWSLGDQKPSWGILAMPSVWAVIIAGLSWFFPIRKKKLDALMSTAPKPTEAKQ
jgi:hypothetical protein